MEKYEGMQTWLKFNWPDKNKNDPGIEEIVTLKFNWSKINPNDLNIMFCTPSITGQIFNKMIRV